MNKLSNGVNILPKKTQKTLRRSYFLHLGITTLFSISIMFFIGGILLIPPYFASRTQADSYERYRDALEGAVGLKERDQVFESVALLRERIRITGEYAGAEFTVDFFERLFEEQTNAISISALSFSRVESGASITISGVADTRTELLAFVEALRENNAFSDVAIPVSQLVVETDAPFSIKAQYHR